MSREDDAADVYTDLVLFSRRARATSAQAHPDLSLVAYTLLSHVADRPGARATDLAGHYNLDKSTVSRQLAELDALGLISRAGGGRTGQTITLTSKGQAMLDEATDSMRKAVTARLDGWSDEDVARFAELLRRFNAGTHPDQSPG